MTCSLLVPQENYCGALDIFGMIKLTESSERGYRSAGSVSHKILKSSEIGINFKSLQITNSLLGGLELSPLAMIS